MRQRRERQQQVQRAASAIMQEADEQLSPKSPQSLDFVDHQRAGAGPGPAVGGDRPRAPMRRASGWSSQRWPSEYWPRR